MQTQMKQTRIFPRRLSTGLCWFIAVEFFFFAPFKFSPVGVLGYPSYFEEVCELGLSRLVLCRWSVPASLWPQYC